MKHLFTKETNSYQFEIKKQKGINETKDFRGNNRTNEQILYLQGQYQAEENQNIKGRILKEIGLIYLNGGKRNLAYICLSESLRLDPYQSEIFDILKALKNQYTANPRLRLQEYKCMVSVIIPTYNRPFELRESIASIMNQTFKDFEVIVINDAGTDDAKFIVDSFRSNKINYYKLSNNKGRSGARNEGIIRAKGKYIAYLDDDDIFYENHLKTLVNLMEAHPDVDVAYTNAWWVYGEIQENKFEPHYKKIYGRRPNEFDKDKLLEGNYISSLNILHRKSTLMKVGIFNEELPYNEDWDLLLRMAITSRFQQINELTGEYRWKDNNLSILGDSENKFWYLMLKNHYAFFRGDVAMAKYFLYKNRCNEANKYLDEIEHEYYSYYKDCRSLREISDITFQLGKDKFLKILTKDYFELMPRECIKSMVRKKSFVMASIILQRFPARAVRSVIARYKNKFRH